MCARASRPERGCARALLSLNWAAAADWLRPRPVRWAKGSWRRERAAAEGEVGCCSGHAGEEIPSSPRGIERERAGQGWPATGLCREHEKQALGPK